MRCLTVAMSLVLLNVIASRSFSQIGEPTQSSADGPEVRRLKQQITILTAKCSDLERQNALLLLQVNKSRLAGADSTRSEGAQLGQSSSKVVDSWIIDLKPPKSATTSTDLVQKLLDGLAGGNLHLNPADAKLRAEPIGLQRLRLSIRRTSRGLGTQSFTEAGTMWVKQGSLFLQWSPGDQSEACEALRYASLQVGEGPTAQKYVFAAPVEVSLPMATSKAVDLPSSLTSTFKLAAVDLPSDWTATPAATGCDLVLSNKDVKAELKLEPSSRTLTAAVVSTVIDPTVAKRHLDQVEVAYKAHEDLLTKLENEAKLPPKTTAGYYVGALYYPPTVEDRSQLQVDIANVKNELKTTDVLRNQFSSQLDLAQKQAAVFTELQGSTYTLTLPNDVVVAKVTLVAPGSGPAVPVKKGAVHASSTSH